MKIVGKCILLLFGASPFIFTYAAYLCYTEKLFYGVFGFGILAALAALTVGYSISIFTRLRP